MILIILAFLFLRFFVWLMPDAEKYLGDLTRHIKNKLRTKKHPAIFDHSYVEIKALYLREFKRVPCRSYIEELHIAKVYDYIQKGFAGKVLKIYQNNFYNWKKGKQEFSMTIFQLENEVMIEIGGSYLELLYSENNYAYSKSLLETLSAYKAADKEQDYEINIISHTRDGLELKPLAIKPTTLDIDLYYNDDFKPVDSIIRERLAKENDKGIILLHGLPGTGKTTYLRHLIGCMKKRVLFVSPAVAGNLMNPEFMDLLLDNPNAVLVIEDAENIIMDRKYSSYSSVSNLLNISDGLLSDCLNVQIICTFNSDISLVDDALLRKGRLIAEYKFGKLQAAKAQKLSDQLGFKKAIDKPMTIAEIANPDDLVAAKPSIQVMGFRREEVMMN
jgi:ATPase family associated with various cellular activities (AAA)